MLVIVFIQLAKSVLTLLYIKEKRRPLHTPRQVCDNLLNRMLKPTHNGVHSNGLEFALISLSRSQFVVELSICPWVLPTNLVTSVIVYIFAREKHISTANLGIIFVFSKNLIAFILYFD